MKLTTAYFDNAVKIITLMNDRSLVNVGRMKEVGVERSYAVKIMKKLLESKQVSSKEGKGGGYYLTGDPTLAMQFVFGWEKMMELAGWLKFFTQGVR